MRRRRLLLVALVLLGGLVLLARGLPDWLAGQLARTLSAAFHRPVVLGEVRFHAYPLAVELKDLRVGGEGPGSAPFLEVPRVLVTPSIAPLRFGRLVLSRVRLEGPRIYVHSFLQGGDNIPKTGGARRRAGSRSASAGSSSRGASSCSSTSGSRWTWTCPTSRAVSWPAARAASRAASPSARAPSASAPAPVLPVSADVTLGIDGPVVTAESGHLRARGTDLAWRGQIRFGGPNPRPVHPRRTGGPRHARATRHAHRPRHQGRGPLAGDGLRRRFPLSHRRQDGRPGGRLRRQSRRPFRRRARVEQRRGGAPASRAPGPRGCGHPGRRRPFGLPAPDPDPGPGPATSMPRRCSGRSSTTDRSRSARPPPEI